MAEVVCQLKYPPVLAISTKDPADFQERIRGDYPYYFRHSGFAIPPQVSELLASLQIPGSVESVRHSFATEDKPENPSKEVVLSRDFLAISDRKYQRWETFSANLETARKALEAIYRPAFYARVGLRYVDFVRPSDLGLQGEEWFELFRPELVGAFREPIISRNVTEFVTTMTLRVPEIKGGLMRINHGLKSDEGPEKIAYVIDVDIFTEQRSEPQHVNHILDAFHKHAGNFFRWSITPRLRDALDPERL